MTGRTLAGLGFVLALVASGCGTASNLNPPTQSSGEERPRQTRVYGGVRQSWADLKGLDFSDVACINLYFLPFYLADLPLSLIGDTLTLPYTVGVEVHRAITGYYFPKDRPSAAPPAPVGNAFTPLVGNNEFNSWTLSPRVELPVEPKP